LSVGSVKEVVGIETSGTFGVAGRACAQRFTGDTEFGCGVKIESSFASTALFSGIGNLSGTVG